MVVRDFGGWVLDVEAQCLRNCCCNLGIKQASGIRAPYTKQQVVFYVDQFALLKPDAWLDHRITFAYFHGRPGTGVEEFDAIYDRCVINHERFSRVQVSHSEMRDVVLETGICADKVHLIPIAVDLSRFRPATREDRSLQRSKHGIPESAFVVGSFQKDGVGWGEGLEPKLIKGPDVFVDVLIRLQSRVPELFALLSGPARGYVKERLTAAGIPWKHVYFKRFSDLPPMYHALDAYLVSSRQEGGPKAVLESMASGVPLVTTRVGQAMDLVRTGCNAFMSNVEDADSLAEQLFTIYELPAADHVELCKQGLDTAETNSWQNQGPRWRRFFNGVVDS